MTDPDLLRARLIGQERDGGILFSWTVLSDQEGGVAGGEGGGGEEEGKEVGVTCVGWHVFNTNSFITLYRYILYVSGYCIYMYIHLANT